MGEAFGDPEELQVVLRGLGFEVEARPFAEVGGVATEIDGDVPDMTREDANEFALRLAKLVVKTAENTLNREGLVILNELCRKAGSRKG